MDSFYGNMVNLLNAQFQFDKFYPNKKAMDAAANTDNVFTGRHVLIEYDKKPENYFETENFPTVYYPSQEEIKDFVTQGTHGDIYDYLFMHNKTAYFADENYTQLYILNYKDPIIKKNYIDQYCEITYKTGKIRIFIDNEKIGSSLDKITVNTANNEKKVLYGDNVIYDFDNIKPNPEEYSGDTHIKCIVGHSISTTHFYIISYIKNNENNNENWEIEWIDSITASLFIHQGISPEPEYIFKPIEIGSSVYNSYNKDIGIVYKEPEEIFTIVMDDEHQLFIKYYYELTNEYDTDYTIVGDTTKKIVENGQLHYKQLVNDNYDMDKDYYFCMPIANFEITNFETGENRRINEIIDNVFSNEEHTYDFDHTLNYDLTIWRKGHELNDNDKSEDTYREITGYKVPKLDYNLSPDTVLTSTFDNKIKGKKLDGSGKIAVNYGEDEVVVSHERSNNIVNNLGREDAYIDLIPLRFPEGSREWHKTLSVTEDTDINGYPTTTISSFPRYIRYYDLSENFSVWIDLYPENSKDENGNNITIQRIGRAIKTEKIIDEKTIYEYEPIMIGTDYQVYITNTTIKSTDAEIKQNNIIEFNVTKEGEQGILYDPRIHNAFTIPYLELDDYGHAIKARNTQFVLPTLKGTTFTYAIDDTVVNFARQSGTANKLSNTVKFTIGKKTCDSSTHNGAYLWSLSDIGFVGDMITGTTETGEFIIDTETNKDTNQIGTFYPVASKLKNPINIKIGDQTKTIQNISGSQSLEFEADKVGFINRNGDSGIGTLTIKSGSTLSFNDITDTKIRTQISNESINATDGYKIRGASTTAFQMDSAGSAYVRLNKITLVGQDVYGTELPATGTTGQVFFLINETSTNTND